MNSDETVQNGYSKHARTQEMMKETSLIIEKVVVESPVFCAACGTLFVANRPKGSTPKCVRCGAPTQTVAEPRHDGVYYFDENGENTSYSSYRDIFDQTEA